MGSRDKDGTQPGDSDLVSADTTAMEGVTATTTLEEEDQAETAVEHTEDVWATTEGYSPLTDLQDGGAVFHAGPSYNDNGDNENSNGNGGSSGRGEFFASHAGAFFADMAAFGPCDGDEDGEWGDDGVNDNNGYNNIHDDNDDNDAQEAETDFRQVAEKALMALEEDYLTTFQGSSRKPTTLELAAMPEAAVLPSSEEDKRFAAMLFDMSKTENETTDSAETDADGDSKRKAAPANELVLPNIDTDAVRRAVQAIGLGNPTLQRNLTQWEESKKQTSAAIRPRTHPIIPTTSLKAFRMDTAKAVKATANLTRSACIAQALHRLEILSKRSSGMGNSDTLILHVIGCDHVECESVDRIQHWFGFLARWIGAHADTHADSPRHLEIHLMGPNMPAQAAAGPAVDLLVSNTESTSRLETARVMSHVGVYNEWMVDQKQADLVIAFNAGIWGYDDWRPTVEHLIRAKLSIPLVVTAYTLQEAQDDFDVIHDAVVAQSSVEHAQKCCQWQAEVNALASKVPRETATAIAGRHYRENGAWQAWCL